MDTLTALFAAYSIVFVIIFAYSYSIGSRQRALAKEIQMLRDTLEEEKVGSDIPTAQRSTMAEIEG